MICAVASADGTAFERPHPWSFQRDFSDDAGWASSGYAASIRLADIDGDGRADVCGRHGTGIECALSSGRGFGPLRPMMPREFTDGQGWQPDRYGSTFQLGDLDGDGRSDLCGRGIFGLLCVAAPAPALMSP
jgi:hypothetical protein